jgi:hypothetical protein
MIKVSVKNKPEIMRENKSKKMALIGASLFLAVALAIGKLIRKGI